MRKLRTTFVCASSAQSRPTWIALSTTNATFGRRAEPKLQRAQSRSRVVPSLCTLWPGVLQRTSSGRTKVSTSSSVASGGTSLSCCPSTATTGKSTGSPANSPSSASLRALHSPPPASHVRGPRRRREPIGGRGRVGKWVVPLCGEEDAELQGVHGVEPPLALRGCPASAHTCEQRRGGERVRTARCNKHTVLATQPPCSTQVHLSISYEAPNHAGEGHTTRRAKGRTCENPSSPSNGPCVRMYSRK